MITETEQTVTASTSAVALHNPSLDPSVRIQTLLIKNTSANGATLTATGLIPGQASTSSKDISLAASASVTVTLAIGETLTAKRSGASDATLSVLRWYDRD
jgi:hypothetical protein